MRNGNCCCCLGVRGRKDDLCLLVFFLMHDTAQSRSILIRSPPFPFPPDIREYFPTSSAADRILERTIIKYNNMEGVHRANTSHPYLRH